MPVLGRTKRDVVQEFRTSEILEAARSVFAASGFHNSTIDQIAEAAGVAKGTVYTYFPSKRDLFLATLRCGVVGLHEQVRREIDLVATTAGKIRAFMHSRLRYCIDNSDFFRIYYLEVASLQVKSSNTRPEFQDLYEDQVLLLESILDAGIRSGELRMLDARKAAHLIYEVTRAAIAKHLLEWPGEPADATMDLLFELTWRGIQCD